MAFTSTNLIGEQVLETSDNVLQTSTTTAALKDSNIKSRPTKSLKKEEDTDSRLTQGYSQEEKQKAEQYLNRLHVLIYRSCLLQLSLLRYGILLNKLWKNQDSTFLPTHRRLESDAKRIEKRATKLVRNWRKNFSNEQESKLTYNVSYTEVQTLLESLPMVQYRGMEWEIEKARIQAEKERDGRVFSR